MSLQSFLEKKFSSWRPEAAAVMEKTRCSVTMAWEQQAFDFARSGLLYRLEKKEKLPPWVLVYCGSKTTKLIDYLQPSSPHKFRLKVILKASAVPLLAEQAMQYYGDEKSVYERIDKSGQFQEDIQIVNRVDTENAKIGIGDTSSIKEVNEIKDVTVDVDESGDDKIIAEVAERKNLVKKKWLESQWSEETWTNTESDGTSATCFCMAVRGGYLKQMQMMLEERPALIGIINSTNGFTPLATAVRKGDINTVKFLLTAGADIDQVSATGQTPLHLAVLTGNLAVTELLLDRGADFQARDVNGLRVEHYAADSGRADVVRAVAARGGDLAVTDNNGWTPLFRAVCQGAGTDVIEELVLRGSDVHAVDAAGLQLPAAARLLTNRHGLSRWSVVRLVDAQFPRELAHAHFSRLTKKIATVHTIFKPSP